MYYSFIAAIILCFAVIMVRAILREKVSSPWIAYISMGVAFLLYIVMHILYLGYIGDIIRNIIGMFTYYVLPVIICMVFVDKGNKIWLGMLPAAFQVLYIVIRFHESIISIITSNYGAFFILCFVMITGWCLICVLTTRIALSLAVKLLEIFNKLFNKNRG